MEGSIQFQPLKITKNNIHLTIYFNIFEQGAQTPQRMVKSFILVNVNNLVMFVERERDIERDRVRERERFKEKVN